MGERHGTYPRKGGKRLLGAVKERGGTSLPISGVARIEFEKQQVLRDEAGIDLREIDQRADVKSCADQQHQRQGDLRGNEDPAGTKTMRSQGGPVLESGPGIHARRSQRGQKSNAVTIVVAKAKVRTLRSR